MKLNLRALTGPALCLALLSACGNDPQATENRDNAAVLKNYAVHLLAFGHQAAPPPDPATIRAGLAQAGQPVYGVKIDKMRYTNFMAPYGSNGPIQTWASNTYESVSLNDGILVATRGFGADIMSAVAPTLGQVSAGSGFFHRVYYYLDGADQTQRLDFDCDFAPSGAETVTVLDRTYTTRRVTESCSNPDSKFDNVYWFDGSGKLRQSVQFVSVQVASMQLQRVID